MGVEFMPFLIPIAAILGWAAIQISKNLGGGGGADVDELAMDLAALADDLDDAHAESARLRARIEALEMIATHESVDELNPPARDPLGLDTLPDRESDASGASRRQRTR